MSRPILLTHPDCLQHEMPRHPERPDRLRAVMDELKQSGLSGDMNEGLASEISDADTAAVHPQDYIEHIEQSEPEAGAIKVDPDTYMSPGSFRASRLAAGAVLEATKRVLAGEANRAFCAIRPPGHHAEIASALGFCLFNNVAIAAEMALLDPAINRVAILDFDVHHCNGTVDIFKDREEVLVCSSFQNHFYPHRYLDFENEHVIATPLDSGTDSKTFRAAIETSWLSAIEAHKPDLIFVSAGFDAHEKDPLAEVNLQDDDYRWVTELIASCANQYSQGRIISTLEGGYNLESLASGVREHVKVLVS
jgi:acetoin utilization deacetylase AcuC-like enzyme